MCNLVLQNLTQLENLIGTNQGALTGIGKNNATPVRLEQLVPQLPLQRPHLCGYGLHRDPQAIGCTGKAPFFTHNPEIVKMSIIHMHTYAPLPIVRFFRSFSQFIQYLYILKETAS